MNALLRLLRDHQVDTWCKRAAWLTLLINVIRIPMLLYTLIGLASDHYSLSINLQSWLSVLNTMLDLCSVILFDFFILYAAGVALNQFVPSTQEDQDEEDQDEEQEGTEQEQI